MKIVIEGKDVTPSRKDIVLGDKVSGDKITIGNITGSNISVGKNTVTPRMKDRQYTCPYCNTHTIIKATGEEAVLICSRCNGNLKADVL